MKHHCYLGKLSPYYNLEYLNQFQRRYDSENVPTFTLTKLYEAHTPDLIVSRLLDSPVFSYLENYLSSYLGQSTIQFVFSDHGIHFGSHRRTEAGKIELNLPSLFIIVPDEIAKKHPMILNYLKENLHLTYTSLLKAYSTYFLFQTQKILIQVEFLGFVMEELSLPKKEKVYRMMSFGKSCLEIEHALKL